MSALNSTRIKRGKSTRTLAYVFLLEGMIFLLMRRSCAMGFAHLSISPPNTKYADKLRDAYKEARSGQRGLQGQ
ncbi:MAG: thermonuclease family protein [Candidatus Omnitrophica bacterium]|nr:thermonuclease family protein [Candidatus Omnitrophota bacterium]